MDRPIDAMRDYRGRGARRGPMMTTGNLSRRPPLGAVTTRYKQCEIWVECDGGRESFLPVSLEVSASPEEGPANGLGGGVGATARDEAGDRREVPLRK